MTNEPIDQQSEAPAEHLNDASGEMISVSKADFQKLTEESLASKEKYVRLLAEFDNMRKRNERDRADLIKYAHEEVIVECLKLYDDLGRCLNAFKDAFREKDGMDVNLIVGLEMVFNNMKDLMTKYEVKPIDCVGKLFDPNSHEVLMQVESKEVPDGHVIEEFQTGYTLAGRVVRTAKVKVAKNING